MLLEINIGNFLSVCLSMCAFFLVDLWQHTGSLMVKGISLKTRVVEQVEEVKINFPNQSFNRFKGLVRFVANLLTNGARE